MATRLASWIAATSVAVVALLAFTARPAHAQNAAAEALFSDGEKLMKAGKLAEACDAFEASNRLEARAGTLVNLGTCREQNHQLASAWSAFKDAVSRAKDPKKKKIAEARIKAIEPKLSFLTISVADDSRIDGLVVNRDGQPVDPALWNRGIPVDGGSYVVSGRAPGHEEWQTTVVVPDESGKVSVEVPRFKELVVIAPRPVEQVVAPVATPVVEERDPIGDSPGTFTGRRKVALAVGGVAVAAAVAGVLMGRQSAQAEDDAYALCPDPAMACADADRANDLIDRGRQRALFANIGYGVAGAGAITAVVLWITGAPARPSSRVSLSPRFGGLDLAVRF